MKIISRKDFLALKENVLFQKYRPCMFLDLEIKTGNCGDNDFYSITIENAFSDNVGLPFYETELTDEEFPIELAYCMRDGMFDDEEMYAIWSKDDIRQLIESLEELL